MLSSGNMDRESKKNEYIAINRLKMKTTECLSLQNQYEITKKQMESEINQCKVVIETLQIKNKETLELLNKSNQDKNHIIELLKIEKSINHDNEIIISKLNSEKEKNDVIITELNNKLQPVMMNKERMETEMETYRLKCIQKMEELKLEKGENERILAETKNKLQEEKNQALNEEMNRLRTEMETYRLKCIQKMEELKLEKEENERIIAETKNKLQEEKNQALNEEMNRLRTEMETYRLKCIQKMEELKLEKEENERIIAETKNKLQEEKNQALHEEMNLMNLLRTEMETEMETYRLKCIQKMEELKLEKEENERILAETKNKLQEEKNHTVNQLQMEMTNVKTIISKCINKNNTKMEYFKNIDLKNKKVLIYSHFSQKETVENYNYLTFELLDKWFDYIIILTNTDGFVFKNNNKYYVFNDYNFKSDFRNYYMFICQMSEQLKTLKQLCIVNDSFLIVDVGVFENTLEKLFIEQCDFAGLTSSIENTYHLQSYFLNFNENAIHHIIEFFKSSGIPMNHDESISYYELKLTMHMLKSGCICYSVVSNNEIALNTTCYKWKQILKNIGIIKRQHILKQYGKQSISDYDLAFIAKVYASTNLQFIEYLDNHNIKYY